MIRVSFGDLHYVAQAFAAAVRHRDLRIVRQALWVIRENHRRQGGA